jgi:hypothetical protein
MHLILMYICLMTMHKVPFFLLLLFIVTTPFWVSKVFWLLHSKRAEGWMAFEGKGEAGEQLPLTYSVIYFKCGKDTLWFNSMANPPLTKGERVPVRYQTDNPADARVDLFVGIWGDTLVYGGIPALMLIALFVHPEVVPWRSKVSLTWKRPFILLVNKPIP